MTLEIGEARNGFAKDMYAAVERVINDKADKLDEYYILIHCREDVSGSKVYTSKLFVMKEMPPTLQNAICVHIDNRKSRADFLYCLPKDVPLDPAWLSKKVSERVVEDAQLCQAKLLH